MAVAMEEEEVGAADMVTGVAAAVASDLAEGAAAVDSRLFMKASEAF